MFFGELTNTAKEVFDSKSKGFPWTKFWIKFTEKGTNWAERIALYPRNK